jgi:uncharacterized membrane protein
MEEQNTQGSPVATNQTTTSASEPQAATSHDDLRVPAALAYLFFAIPWLFNKQADPFVRFHINQAFGLFLIAVATQIITSFFVPWRLMYALGFLFSILQLAYLLLAIKGALTAWAHKQEPLPFIGAHLPVFFK